MCPDNQLNQWALLKLSSCLSLSHFLSDENKEQNSFFVPDSETSAPDYWRESSGRNTHLRVFLFFAEQLEMVKKKKKNSIKEENTEVF